MRKTVTERQRQIEKERDRDRETETKTEKERQREKERQTHREKDRERETGKAAMLDTERTKSPVVTEYCAVGPPDLAIYTSTQKGNNSSSQTP